MHRPALAGAPTRWAIEALEPRFGSDAVVVGMIIQTAVVGVCPPSHLARQSVDIAFTLADRWFSLRPEGRPEFDPIGLDIGDRPFLLIDPRYRNHATR